MRAVDASVASADASTMSERPVGGREFLVRLAALEPPAGIELDPLIFRQTTRELVDELARSWHEALRWMDEDPALRSDLVSILERIALVHARYCDATPEPRPPRARAAVYAAAVVLLID